MSPRFQTNVCCRITGLNQTIMVLQYRMMMLFKFVMLFIQRLLFWVYFNLVLFSDHTYILYFKLF